MVSDIVSPGLAAMAIFGFTGSLHCAAMCGALAGTACAGTQRSALALWQYHLARLAAYTTLGFGAGIVGAVLVGRWLSEAAQWLGTAFGILMLFYGLYELVKALRFRFFVAAGFDLGGPVSGWRQRLGQEAQSLLQQLPLPRPVALGLATALLPCGFLLAALLQSALFANPIDGALAMALFAVASSPALMASAGILPLVRRLGPRVAPVIVAVLLIVAAVSVLFRSLTPPHDHQHMHHEKTEPAAAPH